MCSEASISTLKTKLIRYCKVGSARELSNSFCFGRCYSRVGKWKLTGKLDSQAKWLLETIREGFYMWSEMHVISKNGRGCLQWVHLFQEALQMYWKIFSICWLSAWEWSCIVFQGWLENVSSTCYAVLSSGNQKRGFSISTAIEVITSQTETHRKDWFALERWVENILECINNLLTLIKGKLPVKLNMLTIHFPSVLASMLSNLGHTFCWLVILIAFFLSGCSTEFCVSHSNGYSKLLYALWYNQWPVP